MNDVNDAAVGFGGMAANIFGLLQTRRAQNEKSASLVVVTSALIGEGKSFIAEGLSIHLAALSSMRVLLVDANPARPLTTARFKAVDRTGLLELLVGDAGAVEPAETEISNLSVLGIGRRTPEATLMLRQGSLDRFVAWVSQRSDVCVVDAGPLMEPGAPMLVNGAMQAVLVVDSRRTSREAVASAISKSSCAPGAWGVVLNRHSAWR